MIKITRVVETFESFIALTNCYTLYRSNFLECLRSRSYDQVFPRQLHPLASIGCENLTCFEDWVVLDLLLQRLLARMGWITSCCTGSACFCPNALSSLSRSKYSGAGTGGNVSGYISSDPGDLIASLPRIISSLLYSSYGKACMSLDVQVKNP